MEEVKGCDCLCLSSKMSEEAVKCNQAPVTLTQVLDESIAEVNPSSGQDAVF